MSQPTFLIVDDEPTVRMLLRRIIGYRFPQAPVDTAGSLAEVRQKLRAGMPRVIITTFFLSDGTATAILAEVGATQPKPAVFVTAADSAVAAEALAAGATAFLAQPFDVAQLLQLLTAATERRES